MTGPPNESTAGVHDPGITCAELLELTTHYLDGALPAGDQHRFEAHVRTCEGCTIVLDQLRTQLDLTGQLNETDLPADSIGQLLDAFSSWKREREDDRDQAAGNESSAS